MTTFILIFASAVVLWLWLTVLAAMFLASSADDLYEAIRRKGNRRKHSLAKWLQFHNQIQ
jgi:type II secretory pathway component PulK